MSARPRKVPSYRLHKPTGQAVVRINGHDQYLGKHGTEASHEAYHRAVAEWLATGQHRLPTPAGTTSPPGITVSQLILAFWKHAEQHYRHADGTPTGELDNLRDALRPVRKLYGHTPACDFGPLALRAVREDMVRAGLCRAVVNDRVKRARRAFRWAASVELIPVSVVQALDTVDGLKKGRCAARESEGVKPVRWEHVEATLPFLPRPVAAVVQLMRYSNCRARDAVLMRGCDLETAGKVWAYRPATHKNQWREEDSDIHERVIPLGPRAQAAVRPFLTADPQAYLFSPRQARAEYQALRSSRRTTKRTPSELRRRRKALPRRAPRERYDVNSLQQSVRKACRKAGVPAWGVLQVRHARATEVRERYGVEGAQASLGHARVETAQIYAERSRELARRIAREIG
jgi:integrase